MTYQNMARALRNYTTGKNGKRNIMERVKKKLHYKFVDGILQTVVWNTEVCKEVQETGKHGINIKIYWDITLLYIVCN